MSFKPKEKKMDCPDFKPRFLERDICKLSYECKKTGYTTQPFSQRCTGVKRSPRPKAPGAMGSGKAK